MTHRMCAIFCSIVPCLAGCGVSYDIRVFNDTAEPIKVALVEQWYGGSESVVFSSALAPDRLLEYSARDCGRSEGKLVRISRDSDSPAPPLVVTVPVGERLLPRRTEVRVSESDGVLITQKP